MSKSRLEVFELVVQDRTKSKLLNPIPWKSLVLSDDGNGNINWLQKLDNVLSMLTGNEKLVIDHK